MEVMYQCSVVKYDPGENFKINVVFILNYNLETEMFKEMVSNLLTTSFYLPIKSVPIINQITGDPSEFYYSDLISQVHIQFLDQNSMLFHFNMGSIDVVFEKEQLDELGFGSIKEMCEENIFIKVVLTNNIYSQGENKKARTYYISGQLL